MQNKKIVKVVKINQIIHNFNHIVQIYLKSNINIKHQLLILQSIKNNQKISKISKITNNKYKKIYN